MALAIVIQFRLIVDVHALYCTKGNTSYLKVEKVVVDSSVLSVFFNIVSYLSLRQLVLVAVSCFS